MKNLCFHEFNPNTANLILRVAVAAPVYSLFDYLLPLDFPTTSLARGLRLWVPFNNSHRLGFLWENSELPTCDPLLLKPVQQFLDTESLWLPEDLDLLAWTARYYKYPLGEVLEAALPKSLRQREVIIKKSRKRKVVLIDANEIAPQLTYEQMKVVTTIINALGNFLPCVLNGEMVKSKSEVYLYLIQQILINGGQILILMPEVFLVSQLVEYLTLYLSAHIAILHSQQTELQRERNWQAAKIGIAKIIIGTRLSVFTPVPKLALIIIDDEHNSAFKSQQDGFRYSARDVAIWRAKQRHCPIVLVSATPSLETLHNVAMKRYLHLNYSTPINQANNVHFDLIDMRTVHSQAGLSPTMIRLLKENVAAKQQSLLLLNRRGYAPVFICYACGWIAHCSNCDARLTVHIQPEILWCHHCGARQPLYQKCPVCQNTKLKGIGQGTERLENFLIELLGEISLLRIDSDSVKFNKLTAQDIKSASHSILIGTQLLTTGYNFPQVTLVGILDLDQGLYGASFRAAERMAQLIMQAAGKQGRVVLQTRHPDHPLLQTLVYKGYRAFAELALQEREQAQLPPFSAQALLCAEARTAALAQNFLDAAVLLAPNPHTGVELLGPVPEVMERRAGKHRFRLLLQADTRLILQQFLDNWVPELYKLPIKQQMRWYLDVDPQEL